MFCHYYLDCTLSHNLAAVTVSVGVCVLDFAVLLFLLLLVVVSVSSPHFLQQIIVIVLFVAALLLFRFLFTYMQAA